MDISKRTTFIFDLLHLYDKFEFLEIEPEVGDRYIGYYLETEFSKSGYLVVKPTHHRPSPDDYNYAFIKNSLKQCRLTGLFNPTLIPPNYRAMECTFKVVYGTLNVTF